jgi:hypothetical protein
MPTVGPKSAGVWQLLMATGIAPLVPPFFHSPRVARQQRQGPGAWWFHHVV